MCHSALLYTVKRRRNFFSLTKVTVCCSFLNVFSDLSPGFGLGSLFRKRLRADLLRPGFQVDLISRASILTAYF